MRIMKGLWRDTLAPFFVYAVCAEKNTARFLQVLF